RASNAIVDTIHIGAPGEWTVRAAIRGDLLAGAIDLAIDDDAPRPGFGGVFLAPAIDRRIGIRVAPRLGAKRAIFLGSGVTGGKPCRGRPRWRWGSSASREQASDHEQCEAADVWQPRPCPQALGRGRSLNMSHRKNSAKQVPRPAGNL